MGEASLLSGIAVVIDDEIGKQGAKINDLIKQIHDRGMPYLTYTEIPTLDVLEHFDRISFLLLDWRFESKELAALKAAGGKVPPELLKAEEAAKIEFLKRLQEECFAPVFIFTNEQEDVVAKALVRHDLYQEGKPNFIFVKQKRDLTGKTRLFRTIERWMKQTPSVYVLKSWEREYQKAKNRLFWDFYGLTPSWPSVLWKTFTDDGANATKEIGTVIMRNLYTRMAPFAFDGSALRSSGNATDSVEMRKVLEGERFIKNEGLHEDLISTGDVFKLSGGKIYLNIRPECDCIANRGNNAASLDDVELYLISGTRLSPAKEEGAYKKDYGHFHELDCQAIVFSMLDGKTYDFRFKKLLTLKWAELKSHRIGRLLPPYITRIQQRYALYLHRQGLSRTPETAVSPAPAKV